MTRQYIDNKNLNVFVSNRRVPGSTNICNLWTEEVTYETELTFPTLMNKSEVRNKSIVKISPIKNAIKSLLEKNSELKGLEFLLNRNLKEGIDPKSIAGTTMFSDLSRVLAGTVDSPVNGGVGQYRAFFSAVSDEPGYEDNVAFLKKEFMGLIKLLDKLLKLHQAIIPIHLAPQHRAMVELFIKNFSNEINELKLDVNATLNLKKLVDELLKANTRTHRERTRHAGHTYSEFDSLLGSTDSATTGSDKDDMSSVTGSDSVHSGGASTRPLSSMDSSSYMSRSIFSGKKTALNYK
ncbi:unnamed protein product [Ambrosiozyma monospora]|uniref:Unnamed protein product n=1 Tax=Ambrosiozyma monospora TaxID=43982 RepID=A0A9W6Z5E8_AMBMO|nr:unnamed protein product [Ambrosiozyma monospora]